MLSAAAGLGFVLALLPIVANVLNIKAAAVYLTLAPQFLSADRLVVPSMLCLAGPHIMIQVAWLGFWIIGWGRLSRRFDPAVWRRRIDALGGAVLVALGIRTVVAGAEHLAGGYIAIASYTRTPVLIGQPSRSFTAASRSAALTIE